MQLNLDMDRRVVLLLSAAAFSGCYPRTYVGGGVESPVTKVESGVVPVWGAQGALLSECSAGVYRVVVDGPWYDNVLRLVTLGLVSAQRVQVTCAEPKE